MLYALRNKTFHLYSYITEPLLEMQCKYNFIRSHVALRYKVYFIFVLCLAVFIVSALVELIGDIHMLQSLYSPSSKTSYRQIAWSLEAARLDVIMIVSLWNFSNVAAEVPVKFQSDWESRNSRLRALTRFCCKTSVRLVNKGPGASFYWHWGCCIAITKAVW